MTTATRRRQWIHAHWQARHSSCICNAKTNTCGCFPPCSLQLWPCSCGERRLSFCPADEQQVGNFGYTATIKALFHKVFHQIICHAVHIVRWCIRQEGGDLEDCIGQLGIARQRNLSLDQFDDHIHCHAFRDACSECDVACILHRHVPRV